MAKLEAFPMTSGSGLYSYTRNSTHQRKIIESTNELIKKAIFEELEITSFSSSNTFRVADLGCSVGPNTFLAVQNIVDAVKFKYQNQRLVSQLPEFQVLFNDHVSNDFNQLFTSLPPERTYFAVGVPGSFHGRLFPRSSLHFVYSSYALQWLSRVPKEVKDKASPAWNKGRIFYSHSSNEVLKSYEAQYFKDMERFLNARAQEIVHGGLMAIVVPACPNGTPHSDVFVNKAIELLGCCLIDMDRMGVTSEEKVDTSNLSTCNVSPQQVEALVKRNGCFSIEIMDSLQNQKQQPEVFSSTMRAIMEGMIKQHFGDEIDLDKLFDLYCRKLEELLSAFEPEKDIAIFVLLKRIAID